VAGNEKNSEKEKKCIKYFLNSPIYITSKAENENSGALFTQM
jgi:hypothetical protein